MSSFEVKIEKLTIYPHPNADRLELAEVGRFRAVVPKDVYQDGDYALYIPEQAIVPEDLLQELGLEGRLAGSAKNRVKAIRLRGELSQGIVCRPSAVDFLLQGNWGADNVGFALRQDFAAFLQITKWVPEIPVHLSGQVIDGTGLLPWIDIENFNKFPEMFEPGEVVTAAEKIHGTCSMLTFIAATGEILVSSKGNGSKGLAIKRADSNLYWSTLIHYGVGELAHTLAERFNASRVGIFGEIFGSGVQDLTYGMSAKTGVPGYRVFDIAVEVDGEVTWINSYDLASVVRAASDGRIETAPLLFVGPFDELEMRGLASGRSTLPEADNIREGVVVRPMMERISPLTNKRAIAKFISPDYLLRSGKTTEFE